MASSWGLRMNKDKCAVLRFHRGHVTWEEIGTFAEYCLNDQPIAKMPCHKDLGVLIYPTLRFHLHIRATVNKASGMSADSSKRMEEECLVKKIVLTIFFTKHSSSILST